MKIEEIKLVNFRNYDREIIKPHKDINLFFGPNGSGKTNLLEAIHYCSLGKSHRVSNDQSVVRSGEEFALCSVSVRSRQVRREISVKLSPSEPNKKTINIDHKKINRFSELMGCLQCVIFSPEDLGLIKEGPSFRRRYLDMMISQVNKNYFIALQQYKVGMEQRNALLKSLRAKQSRNHSWLEDFENAIVGPAEIIITERKKIGEKLAVIAMDTYRHITGKDDEEFQLTYHSTLSETENIVASMKKQLEESREEDIRLGITTIGPHRDDLTLMLNKRNMKIYASQGQIRTGALSMKLSQMKILNETSGEKPILLLDDVMSELDKTRRMRLLEEINDFQTFITCTDESDLETNHDYRVYQVRSFESKGNIMQKDAGKDFQQTIMLEPDFS